MDELGDGGRPTPRRKKNSACIRCRQQKIRCGDQEPACSNCVKAGVACVKPAADIEASKQYIQQLEQRNQWLEDRVRKVAPTALFAVDPALEISGQAESGQQLSGAQPPQIAAISPPNLQFSNLTAISSTLKSSETSTSSQIGPGQPLAHDVGLLSLANSAEPKYLGPSSGVTFARIIFASAPQSQGLPGAVKAPESRNDVPTITSQAPVELADLPSDEELRYFVDAYFETWQPTYPFIHEEMFQELVTRVQSQIQQSSSHCLPQSMDLAQLFLVVALGAKILESRLSSNFSSESYYATAMSHIAKIQLHDSIRGVQVLLLLVLSSFSFTSGMNAWFLTSTILACCLDLGLQRKHIDGRIGGHIPAENIELERLKLLRSGVFWSAYSVDRTLCVILGRPLTLRDEGIDIEYPGDWESGEIDSGATGVPQDVEPSAKRVCRSQSPYNVAIYLFRFDRITAEIKLMLYRVAQSPARFPWPSNFTEWQAEIDATCRQILDSARRDLKWRGLRGMGLQDRSIRLVELKFHQCLMLLNRPSPAISKPSMSSLTTCYESAIATIRIKSELARFGNLTNSWLHAHAVFVSGITMLYCLWTCPAVRKATNLEIFSQQAKSCSKLLSGLSKTWSVAKSAQAKFDQLVELTKTSWNSSSNITALGAARGAGDRPDTLELPFLISEPMDDLPAGFWDGLDVDFAVPTNMFIDQLGDMGAWFDLNWIGDTNLSV